VADPDDDAVKPGNADATEWADEPIRIEAYDPSWPAQFEKERKALLEAIGDQITGGVHHVGSTAVPGLDAKTDHRHPGRRARPPGIARLLW
jgi:GrpB-like predicted nucleotidyltransferase (UPF0157 family)